MSKRLFHILAVTMGLPLAVLALAGAAPSDPLTSVAAPVSKQTVPHDASTGWVLYGFVKDAQLQPVSGVTIFLVDSRNVYQPTFGSTKTDYRGYFLLNYAGTTTPASSPTPGAGQLFIEITNAKSQAVYRSTNPFMPVPGSSTNYQTIVLPATSAPH
jgi:hypothetical protein